MGFAKERTGVSMWGRLLETSTQRVEHANKYTGGKEDSFLRKHQMDKHQGLDAVYSSKVTGKYYQDRWQKIMRCQSNLMNTKAE